MALLKVAAVLLLVSCASAARVNVPRGPRLVKKVCKGSGLRYGDCVEALNSDFRTNSVADLRALTFLSLDMASANSSEVVGYVDGLLKNSPAAQKPVIASCLESLQSSHRKFHLAIGALMEDVLMANYGVSTAMDGVTSCREAMKSANVQIPEIMTRCGYVEIFSRICSTATDMLDK